MLYIWVDEDLKETVNGRECCCWLNFSYFCAAVSEKCREKCGYWLRLSKLLSGYGRLTPFCIMTSVSRLNCKTPSRLKLGIRTSWKVMLAKTCIEHACTWTYFSERWRRWSRFTPWHLIVGVTHQRWLQKRCVVSSALLRHIYMVDSGELEHITSLRHSSAEIHIWADVRSNVQLHFLVPSSQHIKYTSTTMWVVKMLRVVLGTLLTSPKVNYPTWRPKIKSCPPDVPNIAPMIEDAYGWGPGR